MKRVAWACALSCSMLGCQSEVVAPKHRQVVIVIHASFAFPECPEIAGVSAAPLEVAVGSEIQLRAEVESGVPDVLWSSSSALSSFGDPTALETSYRCLEPGEQLLTLVVTGTLDCQDRAELPIICSASASCGDGRLDEGEECDDGNKERFDGCSTQCLFEVE